jgi:hypothetical protein
MKLEHRSFSNKNTITPPSVTVTCSSSNNNGTKNNTSSEESLETVLASTASMSEPDDIFDIYERYQNAPRSSRLTTSPPLEERGDEADDQPRHDRGEGEGTNNDHYMMDLIENIERIQKVYPPTYSGKHHQAARGNDLSVERGEELQKKLDTEMAKSQKLQRKLADLELTFQKEINKEKIKNTALKENQSRAQQTYARQLETARERAKQKLIEYKESYELRRKNLQRRNEEELTHSGDLRRKVAELEERNRLLLSDEQEKREAFDAASATLRFKYANLQKLRESDRSCVKSLELAVSEKQALLESADKKVMGLEQTKADMEMKIEKLTKKALTHEDQIGSLTRNLKERDLLIESIRQILPGDETREEGIVSSRMFGSISEAGLVVVKERRSRQSKFDIIGEFQSTDFYSTGSVSRNPRMEVFPSEPIFDLSILRNA